MQTYKVESAKQLKDGRVVVGFFIVAAADNASATRTAEIHLAFMLAQAGVL